MQEYRNALKDNYSKNDISTNILEDAIRNTESVFIFFTEWEEIVTMSVEIHKQLMKTPVIFDGSNYYSTEQVKELGINYYSIGR